MKLSILSESPADEEAIYGLAEAVLGSTVERVAPRRQRAGGVQAVINELPSIIRELHFHTDAEALIVVVDSDDTPAHEPPHDTVPNDDCRFCRLTQIVRRIHLPQRNSGTALRVAIGVAVPAIEAWYQCGSDPHIVEAPFVRALGSGNSLASARNLLKLKA